MEDAVVKTIAGFLNTDGGTLFVGIDDQREPIGLAHDTAVIKPPNVDGLVNWLTTHLVAALTHTPVMRTRTRIEDVDGVEICRVDD
jgi:type I restriction enzyme R subunit